tara:strand:- start:62 stop:292 length:231 start_codon:yes stop_codon:yes gene_type:complete
MVKYLIPICFLASCASKQLISDKSTVDGAIKNLTELNRWFYYDNKNGDISDKTLREYENLLELVKYQLEDIKYKKK